MPYKQVETDAIAYWENGAYFKPVATLADKYGGRVQITIDDFCYVLALRQHNFRYRRSYYIFQEAFLVLRKLPPP